MHNPNEIHYKVPSFGDCTPENILSAGQTHGTALNLNAALCHALARTAGWYNDPETGKEIEMNPGERFMLMVSEISEAMEADRKSLMDEKLPNRTGVEVELVDCLIRIFDFAGANGLDLDGAFADKLHYNARRADHKIENRVKKGGKAY